MSINDVNGDGKYAVNDFLDMKNEDILKENGGKKFDVVLMNPPYGAKEDGNYLDIKFVDKCCEISNKQVSIIPAKMGSNASIYKSFYDKKYIKSIDLLDPYKVFGIHPFWSYKYVGIYYINSNEEFNTININIDNENYIINNNFDERKEFIEGRNWNEDIKKLIKKLNPLRQKLLNKYNSMVNDSSDFIYEENRLQRGKKQFNVTKKDNIKLNRVKEYLKEGKYKYCLYKGSGNNSYNKPQEWLGQDPDKLFNGQICWLMNSEKVKNNMIYWMESPIFDLWRIYYFNHSKYSVGCLYGNVPALDFNKDEKEFKEYVDSLNNFNKDDIKILNEYDIHNVNKLKNE